MTTDELRAKFEAWYPNVIGDVQPFDCYMEGRASRDAEIESLRKDAERYRWLSRRHSNPIEKEWYVYGATGPFLSDSIDAAMRDDKE